MVELDGMAVLREAKKRDTGTAVILMTGFGSMEGAIEAIQQGAFDYVSKPFKIDELKSVVSRASKHWDSIHRAARLEKDDSSAGRLNVTAKGLIGKSPEIVEVYKVLARAAMSTSNVLVIGESGTGKELVARAIHDNSPRRNKKFVAVNCGALAENLLESELFGHVKGSFTGAVSDKRGLFEEANSGTLFLDEIGDISSAMQIKLLRVLQENEFKPVGSAETKKVDVRVIAATHRDLDALAKQGKFREDLFYRLKVITIDLPPLRDRMDDLPDLVGHFLARYAEKNKKRVSHISDDAMSLLQSYTWPGNIRELEHAIERAVAMSNTAILFREDFPPEISRVGSSHGANSEGVQTGFGANGSTAISDGSAGSLKELEKAHIIKVLQDVNYNKSKASEVLGIDRATLYRKAQRYGIDLRGKSTVSLIVINEFAAKIRAGLALHHDYAERATFVDSIDVDPEKGVPASVLILFAQGATGPELLVTRRTETVEKHKGQMAFPGGAADPEDGGDSVSTALRETEEEVGLAPKDISVIGKLPPLWTVTGFTVTPVVAVLKRSVADVQFRMSAAEIAEIFWVPWDVLLDPRTYRCEKRDFRGKTYPIHVFQVDGHRIWGATGSMIKNLLDRLKSLG